MSRPRGFVDWRPQRKTLAKLVAVQDVLDQYSKYLPLTLRQIFYRLVGTDIIGKSEKEYANLGEMLIRARKARHIPMDAIRDDGFIGGMETRVGYTGTCEFIDAVQDMAAHYAKDRQAGQDRRIVLLCEAGGMVPQLERVATPYGVTVKSSGGFDSTTVKHGMAEAWCYEPVTVLHVGDYDPSGECMFDALSEEVLAFSAEYDGDIEFVRLAVTPEHIAQYSLPTAPPKASTHQKKKQMQFTTQVEALDPVTLANIVRTGIEAHLDMQVYRQAMKQEQAERETLQTVIDGMGVA